MKYITSSSVFHYHIMLNNRKVYGLARIDAMVVAEIEKEVVNKNEI